MSELKDILREEYIKQVNQLDLRKLLEMVEDVMSGPLTITEDQLMECVEIIKKTILSF